MGWLSSFIAPGSIAQALVVLSLIGALGLWIGRIKIGSIKVDILGVLLAGIGVGHLGVHVHAEVLEFVREFGLILFVYTIGMQVGPGFAASLKKNGLLLGALAAGVVMLGVVITLVIAKSGHVPPLAAVGLYSGGITNTPCLGAIQQAMRDLPVIPESLYSQPGTGYALAYPFGIIGTILSILAVRWIFRIPLKAEVDAFAAAQAAKRATIRVMNIEITNPNLESKKLSDIPTFGEGEVVISRVWHSNLLHSARPDLPIQLGDILLAVGPKDGLEALRLIVGRESNVDLREMPGDVVVQRAFVTQPSIVNHTLEELELLRRYGVAVTRVIRGEVELAAAPELSLCYGDILVMVGQPDPLQKAMREIGNQPRQLNQPPILPIFVGLLLGVVLGSLPLQVPGMSVPLKLGLAGGPLVVAMLLAHSGRVGPLVWYLPGVANFTLREVGIVLFLACVGLKSGDGFMETLIGGGWVWMLWAAFITVIPLLIIGVIARVVFKINYLSIAGLMAGSHTDPPALAFAGTIAPSEAPAMAYATVYPLVMLLRVLSGQVLVIIVSRWL